MEGPGRYLSPEQASAVYDRVGSWQDTQAFYERPAVDALIRSAAFTTAREVIEVGCGTGALAAQLLSRHLPSTTGYVGLDVSPRMVALTRSRLRGWSDRVQVTRIDARDPWPVLDGSADRVVATYVLDLLSPAAIEGFFAEASRVLRPGGLVATVSLARGAGGLSRLISTAWSRLWQLDPHLTGGCRPLDPAALLPNDWRTRTNQTVAGWGIASAVLIAEPAAE